MPMPEPSAPNLSVPPLGDSAKADRYVASLVKLIEKDRVKVIQTDLSRFDLSSMQNHYRIELGGYDVEISHSIQTETNKDFYTMLFNSIRHVQEGESDKVVLAYIHLNDSQFARFKASADEYLERRQREADASRFTEVMAPIDDVLNTMVAEVDPNAVIPEQPLMPTDNNDQNPEFEQPLDDHR